MNAPSKKDRLTLAVDAMGGDAAPAMVIEGLDLAMEKLPNVRFQVFGDEAQVQPLIDRYPRVQTATTLTHTADRIPNEMKPSAALRQGRKSSMALAINAVKAGEADGIVSAGNTGALMALAMFGLRMLPGISRPGIASFFPTMRGETVMLDLGANVDCDAENLVQFAVMGEVFARQVLGHEKPSVGILNVGAEDQKGNSAVKAAFEILSRSELPIDFYGFVEGDDIGRGTVDVVVTDGFTGNIALKTAEGTARLFGHLLKEALMGSTGGRLGALLARPALKEFKKRVDPRRYNGAMFLGLNGICVKSHGGTDAVGFAHAVEVAVELILDRLNDEIHADYSRLLDSGALAGLKEAASG
ncbi:MAG: phosphate acyltransferase PlsX [Magnetovibrionaceae bacterium]